MSEAELQTAISNLETLINSGASTVTQDGHTTVFNLGAANARLKSLRKELAILTGQQSRRPFFNRIDLS